MARYLYLLLLCTWLVCCCVCCCVFRPNLRITMYTSIYQRIPAYTRSAFDLVALLSVCSVYSLCEPFRYLPAVKVKSHCLIHGFTASRTLALLPADTVQPSPCASSATTPSNFCTLPLFCQSYATDTVRDWHTLTKAVHMAMATPSATHALCC